MSISMFGPPDASNGQIQIVKTLALGTIAQGPKSQKAAFENAMSDLNGLALEYANQGETTESFSAFMMAIPVFLADLHDKVSPVLKAKMEKKDTPKPPTAANDEASE